MNYYNDNDPYVAQWLRNLVDAGLLPPGDVDERSITEVTADDLRGYRQVHLFCGIAGWPLALQIAGYGDLECWTGSCPCQPFSAAGKRGGHDDSRDLWPVFRRLIATCQPDIIFGEQVASSMGRDWIAEVRFDLENVSYWRVFEENLHRLRKAETVDCLSEILGSVAGWEEAALCELPAGIRDGMASEQQGPPNNSPSQSEGTDRSVCGQIQRGELGTLYDNENPHTVPKNGNTLRFGRPSRRVERTVQRGSMRNDGFAVSDNTERAQGMGQCIAGQNQPDGWLRVLEHSRGLFRDECGTGGLGGSGIYEDCKRIFAEDDLNDERRIAEKYRAIIAHSISRLRKSTVPHRLEQLGYACGAADLSAAGVGAPHIRQRLYWVADCQSAGRRTDSRTVSRNAGKSHWQTANNHIIAGSSSTSRLAQPVGEQAIAAATGRLHTEPGECGATDGLGNAVSQGLERYPGDGNRGVQPGRIDAQKDGPVAEAGAWIDVEWLPCADGKARPTQPGIHPLADGLPDRVGQLRAYGNAIVPEVAAAFIQAYMATQGGTL